MLIVDSREKKWLHIKKYLDNKGYEYEVRALDTGDYMNEDMPGVIIDRKQNLNEVCQNLCSRDNNRFWREIRRSKKEGVQLIVLVEHGGKIKAMRDVAGWKNKYSSISGTRLLEEMYRVEVAYGVKWMFCCKQKTPSLILELLGLNKS